ncbi:MAG: B12-binding domain-containing radical SAM protein [Paraclostridium sp.]
MSKICLVRPIITPYDPSGMPLNLLILATELINNGHEVIIKDYDFLKEFDPSWNLGKYFSKEAAKDILSTECSYVGITSICSNYVLATELSNELKKLNPNLHITLGGPQSTMCAKETLEIYDTIDSIIVGEGEITYPDLIEALDHNRQLESVLGIAFRDIDKKIKLNPKRPLLKNLDMSPIPSYELIDIEKYLIKNSKVQIYVGTGCPYNCSFCTTSLVWERKYRVKSVKRVIQEMEFFINNFNVDTFDFIHDNLTSNKSFVTSLANEILNKGWSINFEFSSRIDTIDEEIIEKVSSAGCSKIFFGIEHISERIQKIIGKGLSVNNIQKIINCCIKNDICPQTSFILGFPEETIDELEDNIKAAFRCKVVNSELTLLNILSVYSGSKLYEEYKDSLIFNKNYLDLSMINFLDEKHFKEIESYPSIYPNYYSLNYNNSALNVSDYIGLFDFLTICIENYTYTIHVLINELNHSILDIYKFFKLKLSNLTNEDKNLINFYITKSEFNNLIEKFNLNTQDKKYVRDAYIYDSVSSCKFTELSNLDQVYFYKYSNWLVYISNLNLLDNENNLFGKSIISKNHHYSLLINDDKDVIAYELTEIEFEFLKKASSRESKYILELLNDFQEKLSRDFINTCQELGIIRGTPTYV